MITLKLIVNDYFLASHIIQNYSSDRYVKQVIKIYKKDLVNFQNLAYAKSVNLCKIVDGRIPIFYLLNFNSINKPFSEIGISLDDYFIELINSNEFKILKLQTVECIEKIKNEWDKNFKFTSDYIKSLGINIAREYTVVLTHPGLHSGSYLGNNKIKWGYQNLWPNYNTIYLWHEILHSYFKKSLNSHALIEFITNEEMRVRLNGGEYPPFIGHSFLEETKHKNFKKWKSYLKNKDTNIIKLLSSFI